MPSARRRALALCMLLVSSVALLATSPAQYEADIGDMLAQELELTGDEPAGATSVRLLVSASALAGLGESAESRVEVRATAPEADAADGLAPEFRVTATAGGVDLSNDGTNPDIVSWRVENLCPAGVPCESVLEITVEWLNAVPGAEQAVVVTVEAGIDYRAGFQEGETPAGADLTLEIGDELARAAAGATLRAATEPETITLTADAPFALRHVTLTIADGAIPLEGDGDSDLSAIFAVSGLEEQIGVATVVADEGQASAGDQPGTLLPLWCEPGFECVAGFTLLLEWTGRQADEEARVTWGFSSVARYGDRAEPPAPELMTAAVDRIVETSGEGRDRLHVEIGGEIARDPGQAPVEVPFEPVEGPHLFVIDLPTWEPTGGAGAVGIPSTGVLTLSAKSADGSGLIGPVSVSVVTRHPVVQWGPPRNHELTPDAPELTLAVLPTMSCWDPEPNEGVGDGRCTVPFDIYVQTPAEPTGPVIVEWSLRLQAIAADGLTLQPGDVRAGPTR